jgi:hypothetical protein
MGLIRRLGVFRPYSAGSPRLIANLTLDGPGRFVDRLIDISRDFEGDFGQPLSAESRFDAAARSSLAAQLLEAFDREGSDKGSLHRYHPAYAAALLDLPEDLALLEIGLGSNNPKVASNMGVSGRPGASLRAFARVRPSARLFGADVDRGALFSTAQIKTFWVDQTDAATVRILASSLPELDLVIDDGLHSPDANLAIVWLALARLRPGGWLVIEDIPDYAIPLCGLLARYLSQHFEGEVVTAKEGNLFVARRRKPDTAHPSPR